MSIKGDETVPLYSSRRSTSSLTATASKGPVIVVIEIGERLCRVGFAGDFAPREIFFSESLNSNEKERLYDQSRSDEEQTRILTSFFREITLKKLLKSSIGGTFVLVDNLFTPTRLRDLWASALFENPSLNVDGLLIIPSPLANVLAYNIKTALVIDLGIRECFVTPVAERIVMGVNTHSTSLSTLSVERRIKEMMRAHGRIRQPDLSERELSDEDWALFDELKCAEDILYRFCFATTRERGLKLQQYYYDNTSEIDLPPPNVEIPFRTERLIVPGYVREAAAEVLFESTDSELSVPQTIINCVSKVPIDLKRPFISKLLVVGGLSNLKGLLPRLKQELLHLLSATLALSDFVEVGFHWERVQPNINLYSSWLGASLFSSLEVLQNRVLTKKQWEQCRHVPDWTDLPEPLEEQLENIDVKVTQEEAELPWFE